jgi:DNA-binding response OmpR family regulator
VLYRYKLNYIYGMDSNLKIAIVEDNDDLRSLLIDALSQAGYFVRGAESAEQLDELFSENTFDVIVIDINLPGENGYSIASRYRRFNSRLNIVMLTARTAIEDKVAGYESGADLYLTKPVSNAELLAAMSSIERRVDSGRVTPDIVLNLKNMTLTTTKLVELNKQEVLVIKSLSEAASSNLPYFKILEICGDRIDEVSKATLEVRIARLRKKFIEAGVSRPPFRALRGDGYQLLVDVHIVL